MKIERNVLLERFERTQHYGANHHDDDDSASDSDAPLKDTFPRPQLSDVDMNDHSLYMPTSAATTTSTVSGRGRRKNPAHLGTANALNIHQSSTGSTPRQQSINNIHADLPVTPAPVPTTTPARKPRAEKDPHAPKRPANAFVMFCQSERPSIKSSGIDMTSSELTRAMSAKWKGLPKSEKQKFYDIYEREMVRYQQELLSYKEGTAPPTPASDSAATKITNAQPSSAVTADGNSNNDKALSADPLQPSSASSTSSAFAASEAAGASAATVYTDDTAARKNGVISGANASPTSQRNGTHSPKYAQRPVPIADSNDGISNTAPVYNGVDSSMKQQSQSNGNSVHSLLERPDANAEQSANTYTTKSIEDGMRTTALHETSTTSTQLGSTVSAVSTPNTAKVAGQT
ncbi:non-histone protein [Coemansia sp. RSA 1646]|nr:non-histone protein [Coemansia sp. RSA 1646]